ncbi:MAG: phage integrase SAM-like domain-containing protein, partial [Candidatus Aerophobus sp.]
MASVYKRGNVWYLSYHAGGRRVRKSVGKSKKLAILAQKEVEVGLAKKKLGWEEIRDPTFYDFQEKYLRYLQANTRPTTYLRYRKALQHFTDFLTSYGTASAKLSQISFQLIEEYKQERRKAVKPLTVN